MPVAIVGPGRSGTSVVAHALSLCGLYLGEDDAMMPPNGGNPDGYFEHMAIVQLNEDLLASLGYGWDTRPIDVDWASERLEPFRDRARAIITTLDSHEHWGWKDPRTSFTLPFWEELVPNLKVVMCVRHPFDVAASLNRQHFTSTAFGLHWWSDCVMATLAAHRKVLMVSFADLLANPQDTIESLAIALRLVPTVEAYSVIDTARQQRAAPPAIEHHLIDLFRSMTMRPVSHFI